MNGGWMHVGMDENAGIRRFPVLSSMLPMCNLPYGYFWFLKHHSLKLNRVLLDFSSSTLFLPRHPPEL
jgi:hypothetical protein